MLSFHGCSRRIGFGSGRTTSRDVSFRFKKNFSSRTFIPKQVQCGLTGTKRLSFSRISTDESEDIISVRGSELGCEDAVERAVTPFLERAVPIDWQGFVVMGELINVASSSDKHLSNHEPVALEYEVQVMISTVDMKDQDDVTRHMVEDFVRSTRLDSHKSVVHEPPTLSSLQALETVPHDQLDGEEQCAICTDEYGVCGCESCKVFRLPCSHKYHADCIMRWFARKHACPICRFCMPHEVIVLKPRSLYSIRDQV